MKRLYLSIVALVISISLFTFLVAVAASAGQRTKGQEELMDPLAPVIPVPTVIYVKPNGSGDCSTWTMACELPDALQKAVSGDEIWVAKGNYKPAKGLPLSELTDFTFVAWVYFDGGGNWQRIFDFGQDTNVNMFLTPKNVDGIVRFAITTAGNLNEQRLNSPTPLPTGQWVHVAVTLDGDTGRLYIDGKEVDSAKITLNPADVAGEKYWLGESQYPADPTFSGKMDEVAIFDRALNGTEISTTFKSGWDGVSDQVLGLHMEENPAGDFTPIYDSSGLWNDGVLFTGDSANKSITGTVGLALVFDGVDDYVDLPAEREGTFRLKSGVDLYGGFAGGETNRDQRDWQNNVTVLSGDIDENDITDAYGVITETDNISGTNAFHVVTSQELTGNLVLDGITITGGKADGADTNAYGGGLYDFTGAPMFTNVIFSGNAAYRGGGLYSVYSELILTNVSINGNTAEEKGGGLYGYKSDPYLINSIVSGNSADMGGGIYNDSSTNLWLEDSMIGPGNNVATAGGGIANNGNTWVSDSTIAGNSGTGILGGAGIYNTNDLTMINCTVSENVTIGFGGGILNTGSGSTSLNFCTITGNMADKDNNGGGGGGMYQISTSAVIEIKNSIVAGNRLGDSSPASGPDVSGTYTSLGYNLIGDSESSTGFTNGVNHDQVGSDLMPIYPLLGPLALNQPGSTPTHALLSGSPAIDWIPNLTNGCGSDTTADQRGVARPIDGDRDSVAACDIGAFELRTKLYLPIILK